jgi:hypothetical protein
MAPSTCSGYTTRLLLTAPALEKGNSPGSWS